MGLFDFVKDVGSSIFGRGNEAEKIDEMLKTNLGASIENLKVEFDDGTVTLFGQCADQAVKEKAVLLAGNLKGVEKVIDDHLTAPPPPEEEKTEFYTIQRGDSLSKIAKQYYGNAMKYPVIFEANREVIKDPDLIYPGQIIRIPKLSD